MRNPLALVAAIFLAGAGWGAGAHPAGQASPDPAHHRAGGMTPDKTRQHGPGHHAAGASTHAVEMNRTWATPDVDVAGWARRFEDPAREVIARREAIVAALGLRPGQQVADIGAGTGAYLPALSRSVGPKGRVFAVEISAPFAAYMAERSAREGLDNVTVVVGRSDDPTLPPASVDLVLTVNTVHHFEAPAAMLRAIHRALRPGGELVIVDFDPEAPEATARQRAMVPGGRDAQRRLVEAHGFRLLREEQVAGLRQNAMWRYRRR